MTRGTLERLLAAHPMCHRAPSEELRRLAQHATLRRLQPGQVLCTGGGNGTVWFILKGLLQSSAQMPEGTPITIELLRPGMAFGCLDGWLKEPALEDVTCLVQAEVVGVRVGDYLDFVKRHPPAVDVLFKETAERVRAIVRLRAIGTEPARTRVCSVLAFLHEKVGPVIPMTRPLIAMMAGLTTETVSRSMAPLRRRRVIKIRRGAVEILEPTGLHQDSKRPPST